MPLRCNSISNTPINVHEVEVTEVTGTNERWSNAWRFSGVFAR